MKTKSIKQDITLGHYEEFQSSEANFQIIRSRLYAIPMRGSRRKKTK